MRNTTKTLIGIGIAAVIGGTALAGPAYADSNGGSDDHDAHGMGILYTADVDRDGKLT